MKVASLNAKVIKLLTEDEPTPGPEEPKEPMDPIYTQPEDREYTEYLGFGSFIMMSVYVFSVVLVLVLPIYAVIKNFDKKDAMRERVIYAAIAGFSVLAPFLVEKIAVHAVNMVIRTTKFVINTSRKIVGMFVDEDSGFAYTPITTLSRAMFLSIIATNIYVYIKWFKMILDMGPIMFFVSLAIFYLFGPASVFALAFLDFKLPTTKASGKKKIKNKSK